jgi:hypothetical protein
MTSVLPDEAGPHWTRASRGSIRTAALRMVTAESFGYENFYKTSDQLCLGVAAAGLAAEIRPSASVTTIPSTDARKKLEQGPCVLRILRIGRVRNHPGISDEEDEAFDFRDVPRPLTGRRRRPAQGGPHVSPRPAPGI